MMPCYGFSNDFEKKHNENISFISIFLNILKDLKIKFGYLQGRMS